MCTHANLLGPVPPRLRQDQLPAVLPRHVVQRVHSVAFGSDAAQFALGGTVVLRHGDAAGGQQRRVLRRSPVLVGKPQLERRQSLDTRFVEGVVRQGRWQRIRRVSDARGPSSMTILLPSF